MIPPRVEVVALLTGDRYPDLYAERMLRMLARHMPVPFGFTLFTDRERALPPEIAQIRTDEVWPEVPREAEHPTYAKLRLLAHPFAAESVLYLDLTLVIRASLAPLLEFAFAAPHDLVTLRDWGYGCFNSSVMRLRTGALAEIPRAFAAGETVPMRLRTDQDFLHGYLRARGQEHRAALLPPELVASYKRARVLHRSDPAAARAAIESATIVKFHGDPKMHDLLNPGYRFRRVLLPVWNRHRRWSDASFWVRELRAEWR